MLRKASKTCRDCSAPSIPGKSWCQKHRKERDAILGYARRRGAGRYIYVRGHAIARGIKWRLTPEIYSKLVSQKCGYCGKKNHQKVGGLDRIDKSKAYDIHNVISHCGCRKSIKHGMTGTGAFASWTAMKQRCLNEKSAGYANYGGRGIKVCKRWMSFANFFKDMGARPQGKSIDRINVDGDYEPGNCRWATKKEQDNNRRTNIRMTLCGKTKTLKQWCDQYGVDATTVKNRMLKGLSFKEALCAKSRRKPL